MAKVVAFKSKRYTSKGVQVYISESLVRFFRITRQHAFMKEILNSMQKSVSTVQNETKNQIQSMGAVYSGFLRSNIVGWVDANPSLTEKKVEGYIATKAWYDVLVHMGLGIHASPPSKEIPPQYQPTSEQLAAVPSWEVKRSLMKGKTKRGGKKGSRPFLKLAIENTSLKVLDNLSEGTIKGIRNTVAMSSKVPRHKLQDVLSAIRTG